MTAPPTLTPRPTSTVELPAAGSGSRRSQRTSGRRDRRLRRRRGIALVVKVVLALVVVVLLVAGVTLVAIPAVQQALDARSSGATGPVDAPAATDDDVAPGTAPGVAGSARALIVQESTAGRLVSVTVVAVGSGGGGGDVLFVPVGSMVEVPSFGLQALRAAYRDGGLALLQSSLENLLGVQFEVVGVVDPAGIERMVAPAGPLRVDVPHAVEVVDPAGRVEVVFSRGANEIEPSEAARLLAEQGGVADLDRLVRQEAFWRSWVSAIAADAEGSRPPAEAGAVGDVVTTLATGEIEYHLMPVEAVAGGVAADDGLYRVRQSELDELLATILPESSSVGGRISVQVLNGTGEPGVSQRIQPELVGAGAAVTLTGNADHFDYDETQIVYYQDDQLAAARAVQEAIGVGEVVKSLSGMIVVDVTVVVGKDFAVDRPDDRVEADGGGGPAAEGEGA